MHDFVLMRVSKLGYRALIVFAFELISVRRQVGYLIIDLISYSCSTVSSRVVRSEPHHTRRSIVLLHGVLVTTIPLLPTTVLPRTPLFVQNCQ